MSPLPFQQQRYLRQTAGRHQTAPSSAQLTRSTRCTGDLHLQPAPDSTSHPHRPWSPTRRRQQEEPPVASQSERREGSLSALTTGAACSQPKRRRFHHLVLTDQPHLQRARARGGKRIPLCWWSHLRPPATSQGKRRENIPLCSHHRSSLPPAQAAPVAPPNPHPLHRRRCQTSQRGGWSSPYVPCHQRGHRPKPPPASA